MSECREDARSDREARLAAISEFIAVTTPLTRLQLDIAHFLTDLLPAETSRQYEAKKALNDAMAEALESTVSANATSLSEQIKALGEYGIILVQHPAGEEQRAILGIGYSERHGAYQALIGLSSTGQPLTWPVYSGEQLTFMPAPGGDS